MRNGIPAGPLDETLPCAAVINDAFADARYLTDGRYPLYEGCSPLLGYAIKQNETPNVERGDVMQDRAIGDYMPDGSNAGHGWFQLTSKWPQNWDIPYSNARYAAEQFILPAEAYWSLKGYQGRDLAKLIFAEFNAGRGGCERGHDEGDCDKYTEDRYATRALVTYDALLK